MAAKFKKNGVAIYVETLPHRKYPALIVMNEDETIDVVANFKDDYMAQVFVKALERIVKHGKTN